MMESVQRLIDRFDNAAARKNDPPAVRLGKTLLLFICAAGSLVRARPGISIR